MTQKGFTLVELLAVVLILGALAAITVPRITNSGKMTKINACKTNIQLIDQQIEKFRLDTNVWPINYNELSQNPDYFPDGPPECPFGAPYTINGSIHRIQEHNH